MLEERQAAGPVLVFDGGNSLVKPGRVTKELEANRIKARAIADSFLAGGIDGVAVSADDLKLGVAFVRELGLPVVSANLVCDGERPFPASRIVERAGRRIGVVGVTAGRPPGCEAEDPVGALEKAIGELEPVDLVVALGFLRRSELKLIGPESDLGADLWFGPSVGGHNSPPARVAGAWAFGIGSRGKYLGLLSIDVGAEAWSPPGYADSLEEEVRVLEPKVQSAEERIKSASSEHIRVQTTRRLERYQLRLESARRALADARAAEMSAGRLDFEARPLSGSIDNAPAVEAIVQGALGKLAELEGVAAAPMASERIGHGPWAGAKACLSCHPSQHAQWSKTGHARAWATLVSEGHHGDRSCVGCHSTGYDKLGGPRAPAEIRGLRDVQCEACHGPAAEHASAPSKANVIRDPDQTVCTACHDGERDGGRFDWETYRPRVVHGDP